MNYKALDEQDVRRLARDRFGDVLRKDISFDSLCEEMEFYDRFIEMKEAKGCLKKKAFMK